jgi:hypothetical protein
MNKTNEKEASDGHSPPLQTYACTVLITPTTIGDLICAAGHLIRLTKSEAEALAAMDPPRVRIDGI